MAENEFTILMHSERLSKLKCCVFVVDLCAMHEMAGYGCGRCTLFLDFHESKIASGAKSANLVAAQPESTTHDSETHTHIHRHTPKLHSDQWNRRKIESSHWNVGQRASFFCLQPPSERNLITKNGPASSTNRNRDGQAH